TLERYGKTWIHELEKFITEIYIEEVLRRT
ncbi:hypothetical protein MBGDN05_00678, partial [Thermoplasmatales archaeon SCGC AB-539-N05]